MIDEGAPVPPQGIEQPASLVAVPGAPMSAPYRDAPQEEPAAIATPARAWPIMGSSLWTFGVLMWAFVVMGELVTQYGPGKRDFLVNEGLAATFVVAASAAAWGFALRRTLSSAPPRSAAHTVARAVAIAALAFVMWVVVTVCAVAVGGASAKNPDGKITVLLLVVSIAAAIGGGRMAGLVRRGGSPAERKAWRAVWIAGALITLVAIVEIATD